MDKVIVKKYDELNIDELYGILKLRNEVFVVEQKCAYLDIDGLDIDAYHFFIKENEKVVACLRILKPSIERQLPKVGRVVSKERKKGYGKQLIEFALDYALKNLGYSEIYIEAQTYAKGFYERFGFMQNGKEFVEDGIPHIPMICKIKTN